MLPYARTLGILGAIAALAACGDSSPSAPEDSGVFSDVNTDDVGMRSDAGADASEGPCPTGDANECGGCETLSGAVGGECGNCGTLVCQGTNALACQCAVGGGCVSAGEMMCGCADGYEVNGSGGCQNIDECARGLDNCAPEATCTNHSPASGQGWSCACPSGYSDDNGDGTQCTVLPPDIENVIVFQDDGPVPASASRCVTVQCPDERMVLGGGYSTAPRLYTSEPFHSVGGEDTWEVCLENTSGSPTTLYVQAVCGEVNVTRTDLPRGEQFVAAANGGCAEARCPAGTNVTGGGFSVMNGFNMDRSEPSPDGRGWRVCGYAPNATTITASAVCVATETIRRAGTVHSTAAETCIEQRCNDGEIIVGGGAYWDHGRGLGRLGSTHTTEWGSCGSSTPEPRDWQLFVMCIAAPE